MKGPVRDSSTFSFNASAKTITFSAPIPASQQQILAVLNVTRNAWLYLPIYAAYGGTWASPVLTVVASTTGHANGDVLQIFVDDGLASTAITAAALPLPSGAATSANQATANTSLAAIDGKLPALASGRVPVDIGASVEVSNDAGNPLPVSGSVSITGTATVTGPLTDTQLRATAVPVSGTFFQATQPVSAASLPLPSGAATSANQATSNTSLSSIDGKLAALQSGAVPIGDNAGSLTVDGVAYSSVVSFTRPANTTAYTAGSVIGTGTGNDAIHTLANIGPSGGSVIIQRIVLILGISAAPSTPFRAHFFDSQPTAAANGSTFDVASGDRAKYLGYIDFPAPVDLGSTCFTFSDYPTMFKLASGSTSLFFELQTPAGFTPAANSEQYIFRALALEAGK